MTPASRLAAVALLCACSGCGALIDVAWLTSPREHTDWEVHREPTGQVEQGLEVRPEVTDQGELRVDCALVVRDVEREWSVGKTYDEIGWEGAHFLPILLEGLTFGLMAYSVGTDCTDPAMNRSCRPILYATPFYADILWSIYRFTSIYLYQPKLIGKSYTNATVKPASRPRAKQAVACPTDTKIELSSGSEAPPCLLSPSGNGALSPTDLACVIGRLAEQKIVPTTVVTAGKTSRADVEPADRCRFLRAHKELLSDQQAKLPWAAVCFTGR